MFNTSRLVSELKVWERLNFFKALKKEQVEFNTEGYSAVVKGVFGIKGGYRILGEDGFSPNVITTEGQLYLLSAGLAGATPEAAWYLTLWQAAVTPAESWTAANFASTATEIVSTSEGYTGARPVWTPDTPSVEPMSNENSPADFTFATASSVSFQGGALLSSSTRGGTSGILMSAAAFEGGARTQFNTDVFSLVYEESLEPV